MTPAQCEEHDVTFLSLLREEARTHGRLTSAIGYLRSLTDPLSYSERNPTRFSGLPKVPDTRSFVEVMAEANDMAEHGETYEAKYTVPGALTRYDTAREAYSNARTATWDHEAKYTGWNRYWLVTSSPGHIHMSTDCVSCYPTTTYCLVPVLSAQRPDKAIDMFGPAMCSVCFPDAPTGLKVGKALADSVGTPSFTKLLARHQAKIGTPS